MLNIPSDLPAVDFSEILIGLILGAILSTILAYQYAKFGQTLSNRSNLAKTIPLLTLTIVLVISVVKSSLALSLGLVGALSIVRFRTPIKEPEELVYLFVSIAIGLGLGAGQILSTVTATGFILVVATARQFVGARGSKRNLYLNIDVRDVQADGDDIFEMISSLLAPHVESADLRRLDVGDNFAQATLYVKIHNDENLIRAISALRLGLPSSTNITFIDQDSASAL